MRKEKEKGNATKIRGASQKFTRDRKYKNCQLVQSLSWWALQTNRETGKQTNKQTQTNIQTSKIKPRLVGDYALTSVVAHSAILLTREALSIMESVS